MCRGDCAQLVGSFGKRHIQTSVSVPHPFQQELQRERCFARTRRPFDKVDAASRETAIKDLVESLHAR